MAQPYPQQAPAPIQHPLNQPPALPPGTILLDRYLIQGYINGGGFGHIYKAQDTALGYRRAIKEAFYQDAYTRRQFQLEAEFLLNSRHPNLVSAYAVFEQMGRLYLVMDYVDGRTLEELAIDHIRRTGRTLPEAYVLDAVIPICGALNALHSAPVPVIHRDVKPANIKMTQRGVPTLIDLGLAKLYAVGTQTIGAALAFTPGYAPPEQYRASGATDARTDVYGMGATLFYLLTGYQPTESPARLGAQAIPPIRQLNPYASELAERVVIRAMELDPNRRQQSATELERDLRAVRAALGAAANGQPTAGSAMVFGGPRQEAALMCLHCGGANPPVARHCMRCGWRLGEAAPVPELGAANAPVEVGVGAHAPIAPGASDASAAPLPDWLAATLRPDPASSGAFPAPAAAADGGVAQPAAAAQATDISAMAPLVEARAALPDASLAPAVPDKSDVPVTPDAPDLPPPLPHMGPVPLAMWLPASPALDAPPHAAEQPSAAPARPGRPMLGPWRLPEWKRLRLPPAAQRQVERAERQVARAAERLAAFIATVSEPLQRVLPAPRRWQAETLSAAPPLNEDEVRLGLAAAMSVVLGIGTLVAVQWPWALLAAVPALALGHWCLRATSTPNAPRMPEARWLALAGLVVTYTWLGLFALRVLVMALHH